MVNVKECFQGNHWSHRGRCKYLSLQQWFIYRHFCLCNSSKTSGLSSASFNQKLIVFLRRRKGKSVIWNANCRMSFPYGEQQKFAHLFCGQFRVFVRLADAEGMAKRFSNYLHNVLLQQNQFMTDSALYRHIKADWSFYRATVKLLFLASRKLTGHFPVKIS